jgi:hypothetical protein
MLGPVQGSQTRLFRQPDRALRRAQGPGGVGPASSRLYEPTGGVAGSATCCEITGAVLAYPFRGSALRVKLAARFRSGVDQHQHDH